MDTFSIIFDENTIQEPNGNYIFKKNKWYEVNFINLKKEKINFKQYPFLEFYFSKCKLSKKQILNKLKEIECCWDLIDDEIFMMDDEVYFLPKENNISLINNKPYKIIKYENNKIFLNTWYEVGFTEKQLGTEAKNKSENNIIYQFLLDNKPELIKNELMIARDFAKENPKPEYKLIKTEKIKKESEIIAKAINLTIESARYGGWSYADPDNCMRFHNGNNIRRN